MPSRSTVVAALALALLATAAAPTAAKKSKKEATEAPAAAEPAKAPKETLAAAADGILRQVAALRGLAALKPLQRGVLTREEIGHKLKERIAKEYSNDEVRAEARVLKRLGLLPVEADYQQLILDLLMEQVAGFYDPYAAKLYIADWLPLEMQRPALAHEIQHALQDQHFDLKRFAEPIKDNGDLQLARSSLVEGDGTVVMMEFQAQQMGLPLDQLQEAIGQLGSEVMQRGVGNTPVFDKAPVFLKETLMFPYFGGLSFIQSFRRTEAWSRIDELFKDPPESTEQILHPEKYTAHEHPAKIAPAPLPSLGARKELRRDVLGELEWKLLFASKLPEPEAQKAAAGWGGDRLVAYADPATPDALPSLVDLAVWDSETDAKEAEAAARKLFARLTAQPQAAPPGAPGDKKEAKVPAIFADADGQAWSVERDGERTLLLCAVPAETRAQIADEVWRGWKITK